MKHSSSMVFKESVESRELTIFCEDASPDVYNYIKDVYRMLKKHYIKGRYDTDRAIDALYPVTVFAAKKYCSLYGNSNEWNTLFNVTCRYTAACNLERDCRYLLDEDF